MARQTKIEYMISLIHNILYGVFHCMFFCKQLHFYGTNNLNNCIIILLSQWLTMIKDSTKELPLYVNISTKPRFQKFRAWKK